MIHGECFVQMVNGDIWGAFLCPFISLFGLETFVTILLVLGIGINYIKNESVSLASFMLVIGGAVIIPEIEPQMQVYFAFMVIIGLTTAVYNFYRSIGK